MLQTALLAAAGPTDTVLTGPFLLAAVLALAAGAVSFASPCVLPLVPGYLSFLVSLVGAQGPVNRTAAVGPGAAGAGPATKKRTRAVSATALFVAGFTIAFLAQFALFLGLSVFLIRNSDVLTRIGGVLTVLVGVAMLGFLKPLQVERRVHRRPSAGAAGALVLGVFFGLGWTVCLGPTLTGVLALAVSTDWNGNAWRGLFLVLFYCAGLGVPFLLLAFGFGWATSAVGFLRRHSRAIQVTGAVALIVIGLAMVTGLWSLFISWLQVRFAGTTVVL